MIFGIIGILLLAGVLLSKISWGWGVLGAIFLYFSATRFWTKYKAASNAILAHHTFNFLSESDRKKVLVAVSAIMSNAKYPSQDPEQELNSMAPEQRYGFLALGMSRIGIAPKIGGGWYDVHNPYAEILGANREITFVKHQIRLRYGIDVNFSDAVEPTVQPAADQGNANAQIDLGTMYDNETVSQNDEEAVRLNRLAADQGDDDAQVELGLRYDDGIGVLQDYEEAVKWYRLAADQGNAKAQIRLAMHYTHGRGVPQDYEEAVKWNRLAAEQGDADLQFKLGHVYSYGSIVPQDYEEAVKWYRLAADQGNAKAQFCLGGMYEHGRGVPQDYEVAVMWYRLSAAQWNADARAHLGKMYGEGIIVPQDDEEAIKWVSWQNIPKIWISP